MENTNIISACGFTSDGCYGNCQSCLSAEACPVFNDTGTAEAQVEVNPDGTFVRLGQPKLAKKELIKSGVKDCKTQNGAYYEKYKNIQF